MNQILRNLSRSSAAWLAASALLLLPQAGAQVNQTVFSEDFSGASIDTSKFTPGAPFFEGGVGDISASQHDGVLEFTGTVSQQWWAGGTLRLNPTFEASPETNIVVSVDRVAEQGVGTASRSALWIMDESETYYVLFADVRAEDGWRYNRKIGEAGDVPTGGGTIMTAFDGATWDDGGLHRMKAVSDGSTVKLYLDDVLGTPGAGVKFPFRRLVFHVGSYARANADTANTIFDNLRVEEVRTATFSATALTLGLGQTATGIQVRIPPGANASQAVTVRVISSNPAAAIAVGATAGTLTLTFASGGPNEQSIDIQSVAVGGSRFTLESDTAGLAAGNFLQTTVVSGPGVRLTEDFAANSVDTTKWEISQQPFEAGGEGTFEVVQSGGTLKISGLLDTLAYWDGASLRTVEEYIATADLPLVFEMDRVSVDNEYFGIPASAVRTGVFITTADRSQFVFFGQDLGETGWQVNVNPGNPTGSGTALTAFSNLATDKGNHRLKLVANGSTVEVFLDGQSGGTFDFAVSSGIRFEVGAYARDVLPDFVEGVFDNVLIENTIPCIGVAPTSLSVVQGDNNASVTLTLPTLLNAANTTVTITSSAPGVAIPEGAVNGVLNVVFPPGSASTRAIKVVTTGTGTAQFALSNDQGVCVGGPVNLTVTPPPVVVFSDDFASGSIDTAKWTVDEEPLIVGGAKTPESAVTVVDGAVKMDVTISAADWVGFTLWTKEAFAASAASPVAFSVDRKAMEYELVGGTSSKQRTGIWVKDAAGNYVFFSDFGSYDGTQASGWQEHHRTGSATDVPFDANPLGGNYISAINLPQYLDQKNHRMEIVANGATAKLYLDGILGTEVAFPFAQGLTFGFGSYVNFGNSAANTVRGYWDNAVVETFPPSTVKQMSIARSGENLVITWTGGGTLQSADALSAATAWADVTPAPAGSTYTVTPAMMTQQKYYRVR